MGELEKKDPFFMKVLDSQRAIRQAHRAVHARDLPPKLSIGSFAGAGRCLRDEELRANDGDRGGLGAVGPKDVLGPR
jgi:hypothetical protein